MRYQVLRTATADEQIQDIVAYLVSLSGGSQTALKFLDQLEEAADRLAVFPKTGMVPRWGTLAKRGYRAMTVGEYLLLYTIDDEEQRVVVEAVVHGRREYWRLV